MIIANFFIYILYMIFNALCIKLAIDWGFNQDIGWKSALLFSLVSSMFVVLHKYRNTSNDVSSK
jgi:surface polysaccharide O-acyltransferase-like enzyme